MRCSARRMPPPSRFGALKDDLLIDLRKAVEKAITGASTLQDFRKDFDQIVAFLAGP